MHPELTQSSMVYNEITYDYSSIAKNFIKDHVVARFYLLDW